MGMLDIAALGASLGLEAKGYFDGLREAELASASTASAISRTLGSIPPVDLNKLWRSAGGDITEQVMNTTMQALEAVKTRSAAELAAIGQQTKQALDNARIAAESGVGQMTASTARGFQELGRQADETASFMTRVWQYTLGGLIERQIAGFTNRIQGMFRQAIAATGQMQSMEIGMLSMLAREETKTAALAGEQLALADAMGVAEARAKALMDELSRIAVYSPYRLEVVQQTFRQAMAFGYTADEAQKLTEGLLNVAAGTGATNDMLQRMGYNLAQIRMVGKVTATDFRQLAMAGFDLGGVLTYMGEQAGITIKDYKDFNKALEEGKIKWQDFATAFKEYADVNFGGSAERMSTTLMGLQSTFADIFVLNIPKLLGPVVERITESLNNILQIFEKFRKSGALEEWGERLRVIVTPALERMDELINALIAKGLPGLAAELQKANGLLSGLGDGLAWATKNTDTLQAALKGLLVVAGLKLVFHEVTAGALAAQKAWAGLTAAVGAFNTVAALTKVGGLAGLKLGLQMLVTPLAAVSLAITGAVGIIAGIVLWGKHIQSVNEKHDALVQSLAGANMVYDRYVQAMKDAGLEAETLTRATWTWAQQQAPTNAVVDEAAAKMRGYAQALYDARLAESTEAGPMGPSSAELQQEIRDYAALNQVFADMALKQGWLTEAEYRVASATRASTEAQQQSLFALNARTRALYEGESLTDTHIRQLQEVERSLRGLPPAYAAWVQAMQVSQREALATSLAGTPEAYQQMVLQLYDAGQAAAEAAIEEAQAWAEEYGIVGEVLMEVFGLSADAVEDFAARASEGLGIFSNAVYDMAGEAAELMGHVGGAMAAGLGQIIEAVRATGEEIPPAWEAALAAMEKSTQKYDNKAEAEVHAMFEKQRAAYVQHGQKIGQLTAQRTEALRKLDVEYAKQKDILTKKQDGQGLIQLKINYDKRRAATLAHYGNQINLERAGQETINVVVKRLRDVAVAELLVTLRKQALAMQGHLKAVSSAANESWGAMAGSVAAYLAMTDAVAQGSSLAEAMQASERAIAAVESEFASLEAESRAAIDAAISAFTDGAAASENLADGIDAIGDSAGGTGDAVRTEVVDPVEEAAKAAARIAGIIDAAQRAFDALAAYGGPPADWITTLGQLADDLIAMVKRMGEAAESLKESGFFATDEKGEGPWKRLLTFLDAAGAIIDTIGKTADVMENVEGKDFSGTFLSLIDSILTAVTTIGDKVKALSADPKYKDFSIGLDYWVKGMGTAVGLIGGVLETLTALAEWKPVTFEGQIQNVMDALYKIALAIVNLRDLPEMDQVTVQTAKFAANLGALLGPLFDALGFLAQLDAFWQRGGMHYRGSGANISKAIDSLSWTLKQVTLALVKLSKDAALDDLDFDALKKLAAALKDALGPVKDALDFLGKLDEFWQGGGMHGRGAHDSLVKAISNFAWVARRALIELQKLASEKRFLFLDTDALGNLAALLGDAIKPLSEALGFLEKLDEFLRGGGMHGAGTAQALRQRITWLAGVVEMLGAAMADLSQRKSMLGVTLPGFGEFVANLGAAIKPFADVVALLDKLADVTGPAMARLRQQGVAWTAVDFIGDILALLGLRMKQLMADKRVKDIGPLFKEFADTIGAVVKPYADTVKLVGDITKEMSEGVRFAGMAGGGRAGAVIVEAEPPPAGAARKTQQTRLGGAINWIGNVLAELAWRMKQLMANGLIKDIGPTFKEFADTIGAVVKPFSDTVKLISDLTEQMQAGVKFGGMAAVQETRNPTKGKGGAVGRRSTRLAGAIGWIGDVLLEMARRMQFLMRGELKDIGPAFKEFSDTVGSVVKPFGEVLGFIVNINDILAEDAKRLDPTAASASVEAIAALLGTMVTDLMASDAWAALRGLAPEFKTFVGALETACGALLKGIEALKTLAAWEDSVDLSVKIDAFVLRWAELITKLAGLKTTTQDFVDADLRRWAEAVGAIADGISKALKLLIDLRAWKYTADIEFNAKKLVASTMVLMEALRTATTAWTEEGITIVGFFGQAMAAVAGGLQGALAVVSALPSRWANPAAVWGPFIAWVQASFAVLEEWAHTEYPSTEGEAYDFGPVTAWATAISSVMGGLRAAVDLIAALPKAWTSPSEDVWGPFLLWVSKAFTDISIFAGQLVSIDCEGAAAFQVIAFSEDEIKAVTAWATAVGSVMSGLRAAFDLATGLPKTWRPPSETVWLPFLLWVNRAFAQAALFAGKLVPIECEGGAAFTIVGFSDAEIRAVTAWATAVGSVMGGLRTAFELATAIPKDWTPPSAETWSAFTAWVALAFSQLTELAKGRAVQVTLPGGGTSAQMVAYTEEELEAVTAWGTAVSNVMGALRAALDVATKFAFAEPDAAQWDSFKAWVTKVFDYFMAYVQGELPNTVERATTDFEPVAAFAGAMGAIFGGLVQALDLFKGLQGYIPVLNERITGFLNQVTFAYGAIQTYATGTGVKAATEAVAAFASAAQTLFSGLVSAFDLFERLRSMTGGMQHFLAGARDPNPPGEVAPNTPFVQRLGLVFAAINAAFKAFKTNVVDKTDLEWVPTAQTFFAAMEQVFGIIDLALQVFGDISAARIPSTAKIEAFMAALLQVFVSFAAGIQEAKSETSDATDTIDSFLGYILKTYGPGSGYSETMSAMGKELASSMVLGMATKFRSVSLGYSGESTVLSNSVALLVNYITTQVEDKLDIASPSRVMAELAGNIPLGIAQGIIAGIPTVGAAAGRLIGAMGGLLPGGDVEITNERTIVVRFEGQAGGGVPLSATQFDGLKRALAYEIRAGR